MWAACVSIRMPVGDIYVDADACPVKQEVYDVAERYGIRVFVVANSSMRVPNNDRIELVVVSDRIDAADDWIVDRVSGVDIVISADVLLAARCLEKGASVLGPTGKEFTENAIGDAIATRDLLSQLRELGTITGGPAPFDKRDRSRFRQRLDALIHMARRRP